MSYEIEHVSAIEILDSRARPTLEVTVGLRGGPDAVAGVPSGASTGSREALELRDHDDRRYGGEGVTQAVSNVCGEIADLLVGRTVATLRDVDELLIDTDGTPTKSRLGANSLVGVSMACARAMADRDGMPLHRWLAPTGTTARLPVPHFNVINGGRHAANRLAPQEFMIAPLGAPNIAEAVRAGAEVYATLRARLHELNHAVGLGDEGGFAPDLRTPEDACALLVDAIERAGYTTGPNGISLALDPAASEFRTPDGSYALVADEPALSSDELIDRWAELADRFPIWSIEDGLGEDDWDAWQRMTARLGSHLQIVGDDILVTNPTIIQQAIDRNVANAALIKVNQIGTISETLDAIALCNSAGYACMVSHRSGETSDTFIADLAVAIGCGQLKSGAPARGERVAKYNRLLQIARAEPNLVYGLESS
jgi:enolase